ncbi:alpha/beta hydrolase family protein [Nocardia sp. NPDC004582]
MKVRGPILAVAVACAALAAPGQAGADSPAGPDGAAFYNPPAAMVPGAHGSLIWSTPVTGSPGLPGATNTKVLYRSVDLQGNTVAVSGVVSVPAGTPPAGGWPVISWAHGTTGTADVCAPSMDSDSSYPSHPYTSLTDQTLAQWVSAGYAVLKTDYQGLGTPGEHGYLIGTAEARAVADIVTAARELDPSVGSKWVAAGHSQGGHAAVWSDAQAREWAPGSTLLGAVALAPASHVGAAYAVTGSPLGSLLSGSAGTGSAGSGSAALTGSAPSAFTPLILTGASTAGDIHLPSILTPAAASLMPLAQTDCIDQLRQSQWGQLPFNQTFASGADTSALRSILDANDPSSLKFSTPLYVAQGKADTVVPPTATDAMVAQMQVAGRPVTYKTYPDVDHRSLIAASSADVLAWVNKLFGR